MTKVAIVLSLLAVGGCKKHETAQQVAPAESAPVVAATAPSATVETPVASIAPSASASSAPHAQTAAEIEAEKQAAKLKALEEAKQYGMIGLIGASSIDGGDFGAGGLGLTGVGEGGGRGEGIGLGNIGTIGRRDGGAAHTPSIRQGTTTVNGRLPPEVIQRIVRQNFGRFRLCYESGLKNNPSLQGRVITKYVIDHDGSVKMTQDNGSDLPDQTVVQCVVRAFGNLSYPQPEGGIVTVVFPLIFSPGS